MSAGTEKKQALKPVYLITGSDAVKVARAAARLRQRVIDDTGSDLSVERFDAADCYAQDVIQAASTPSFIGGLRLVMVKNIGAWPKAEKDVMATFLADPPAYACLAFTGGGIRKNEALAKAVAAAGRVLVYEAPRSADLPRWARDQAGERQLNLGAEEARRLVELAGTDQQAILTEIEKLSAYMGRGRVQAEDIEAVCWVSPEVRVWDLTDAIGARDRQATFSHLEELMADGSAPPAVFYTIATHLRRLAAVVEASERGEDAIKAATALGLKPFPAKKLAQQSRRFTAPELKQAVALLSELDADLKGRSQLRQDLALEMALARIMAILVQK